MLQTDCSCAYLRILSSVLFGIQWWHRPPGQQIWPFMFSYEGVCVLISESDWPKENITLKRPTFTLYHGFKDGASDTLFPLKPVLPLLTYQPNKCKLKKNKNKIKTKTKDNFTWECKEVCDRHQHACICTEQKEQATIYKIAMYLYIYTQKLQVYRYFLLCICSNVVV